MVPVASGKVILGLGGTLLALSNMHYPLMIVGRFNVLPLLARVLS